MKTTTLLCLAGLTGILAAEQSEIRLIEPSIFPNPSAGAKLDPYAAAKAVVSTEIIARLQPTMQPFSRAIAPMPYPTYTEVQLAENEKRLPFFVSMRGGRKEEIASGYVRLSDNAIFIFRPDKKDYIRSTLDPRFAPAKVDKVIPKTPA